MRVLKEYIECVGAYNGDCQRNTVRLSECIYESVRGIQQECGRDTMENVRSV